MLAEPPDNQPSPQFDLSVLSARIREVEESKATLSQKQLAKYFIDNTILPILNTPKIYEMLQNPAFVEQFTNLLLGFIGTAPKIAPKINE